MDADQIAQRAFDKALADAVVCTLVQNPKVCSWGGLVTSPYKQPYEPRYYLEGVAIVNGLLCANIDGTTYVPLNGLLVEVGGTKKIVTVADASDSLSGLDAGSRTV